jgi:HSP20 family protein
MEVCHMKLVPWSQRSRFPAKTWPETTRLFDRLFEDFWGDRPFFSSLLENGRDQGIPTIDILEKDGEFIISAELPGLEEKDIQLKLEENQLTIKGERKLEHEEKDYRQIEGFYGSFTRSLTLPDTVDLDKVKAEFKNGILKVTIPLKPGMRARSIPVSVN